MKTIGILGIIELAFKQGFNIDKKQIIHELRDAGFRISDKLYKKYTE